MIKSGLKILNILLFGAFISFCLIPVIIILNAKYPDKVDIATGMAGHFMFFCLLTFFVASTLSFIFAFFLSVKYKVPIKGRFVLSGILLFLAISFFMIIIMNSIIATKYGD